jgi:hypothetical protein
MIRTGWRRCVLAGLLAGVLTGCGDLTSGGVGEVDVLLSSGELEAEPATGAGVAAALSTTSIEGTLSVRVQVHLGQGPDRWRELTDGVQQLELDLADPAPIELARREIREGRYDRVRMVFGRVEAEVARGLSVDGDSVTGRVPVDLGIEGRLQVEREVSIDVRSGEPVEIVIELKAADWLRRLDIQACRASSCRVDDRDFEEEFRVRTRTGTGSR